MKTKQSNRKPLSATEGKGGRGIGEGQARMRRGPMHRVVAMLQRELARRKRNARRREAYKDRRPSSSLHAWVRFPGSHWKQVRALHASIRGVAISTTHGTFSQRRPGGPWYWRVVADDSVRIGLKDGTRILRALEARSLARIEGSIADLAAARRLAGAAREPVGDVASPLPSAAQPPTGTPTRRKPVLSARGVRNLFSAGREQGPRRSRLSPANVAESMSHEKTKEEHSRRGR